jgi:hypothetical protein
MNARRVLKCRSSVASSFRTGNARGKIPGIESLVMAPMQQSAEIHGLVTAAMQIDQDKAEELLEVAGLLGNPDDALLDDVILRKRRAGEP